LAGSLVWRPWRLGNAPVDIVFSVDEFFFSLYIQVVQNVLSTTHASVTGGLVQILHPSS
jgi:hypothetical protein